MKPTPLIRAVGGYESAGGSGAARAEGSRAGWTQESLGVMSTRGMGMNREFRAQTTAFTVAVEHHYPSVGRYSRLLSVSGAMSVADFADAILTSFRWPEAVNRVPEAHPTRYVAREDRIADSGEPAAAGFAGAGTPGARSGAFAPAPPAASASTPREPTPSALLSAISSAAEPSAC